MNAPERFTLHLTRFIRAPREKVYDAMTTRDGLAAWMGHRGMTVREARVDGNVGGPWRVEMVGREGGVFVVGGTFTHLQRPASLAYTWQWEGEHNPMPGVQTLVEVELLAKDGGTEVRMAHSGFPAAPVRDGHDQGWTSALNRLSDALDPEGSAGTISLFGDARSTYTRTARMALAEKGVAYTMRTHGPHSPEILALHPFGRMSALRDGTIDIWETDAIVNYIDESFDGGIRLRPGTVLERTRALQWSSAIHSYLYDTMIRRFVLQIIFPKGADGRPDQAVIDKALAEMPTQFDALEKAYGRGPYLAGNNLSAADLLLAPILAYVQHMPQGGALMANYPAVCKGQELIRQRPSFTSTNPQ